MAQFALLCLVLGIDANMTFLVLSVYFACDDFDYAHDYLTMITDGNEFIANILMDVFLDVMASELNPQILPFSLN